MTTAPLPADGPLVDVVIVSYQSRACILAAVGSVLTDAGLPASVTVVDNASSDGTAAAVRETHPSATVIENPRNLGFAAACNRGWQCGRAPEVLFLNPDAFLQPGALPALRAGLLCRSDAGIAGPRTLNPDGTVQVSTGPDLGLIAEWRQRRLVRGVALRDTTALRRAERLHSVEREVDWVSGSCLLVRRRLLQSLGGFDEGYFLYEEDADLCRRARAAGSRVIFTPAATVIHQIGHGRRRPEAGTWLEYQRSHLRYYRRHHGLGQSSALRLLLLAQAAARGGRALLTGSPGDRATARALARLAIGRD